MKRKKKNVTEYKGIGGIYFRKLLSTIISIGGLKYRNLQILDFGSGYGMLKKMLPGIEVTNFDIIKKNYLMLMIGRLLLLIL